MKIAVRRAVEPPNAIRAVVDTVLQAPLEDTGRILAEFSWTFDRDDLHHWVVLLNRIDAYLESVLEKHGTVLDAVRGKGAGGPPAPSSCLEQFPAKEVCNALQTSSLILENCNNKHIYASTDRLYRLLGAPSIDVMVAALQTLNAFHRRPVSPSHKWPNSLGITSRMIALATTQDHLPTLADIAKGKVSGVTRSDGTFHVRLVSDVLPEEEEEASSRRSGPQKKSLEISDFNRLPEDEVEAMNHLIAMHNLEAKYHFALLAWLRSKRLATPSTASNQRLAAKIRLFALFVAFQILNTSSMSQASDILHESTADLASELRALVKANESEVPEELQILAIRIMIALLSSSHTRHSLFSSVLELLTQGAPTTLLSSLLERVSKFSDKEPSTSAVDSEVGASAASTAAVSSPSVNYIEAVMALVVTLSAQSTEFLSVTDAAIASTMVRLIQDRRPEHAPAVAATLRVLESCWDYEVTLVEIFMELNGPSIILQRLKVEIDAALQANVDRSEAEQVEGPPLRYSDRVLIKALLRTLCSATFETNTGAPRSEEGEVGLFSAFTTVLKNPEVFGAGLFAVTCNLVTNVMHMDPLQYRAMKDAGIPETFIDTVKKSVPVSPDAVAALIPTMNALSLNTGGLEMIRRSNVLHCLISIFTTKPYVKTLQGDGAVAVGQNLEELVRHFSDLRPDIVTVCLRILHRLCVIGGNPHPPTPKSADEESTREAPQSGDQGAGDAEDMDVSTHTNSRRETAELQAVTNLEDADIAPSTDPVQAENQPVGSRVEERGGREDQTASTLSDGPSDESCEDSGAYIVECATYTARMLENLVHHKETAKSLVERNGIDLLLELYRLPTLPPTFGSTNASHALLSAFRAISSNATATSIPIIFASLRSRMLEALEHSMTILSEESSQACIPTLPASRRDRYVRALSTTEAFTALAALLVRNSAALLSEICVGGKKSLVLWVGVIEKIVLRHVAIAVEWNLTKKSLEKRAKDESAKVQAAAEDSMEICPASGGEQTVEAPQASFAPAAANAGDAETDGPGGDQLGKERQSKKSPEEMSYDVMIHYLHTARTFYQAIAKAVHVPSRRREENTSSVPTPSMCAASLALAIVMKRNLTETPPEFDINGKMTEAEASAAFAGRVGWHTRYMTRSLDQVFNILFDSRRRTTHCLAFNFFIYIECLSSFLQQFSFSLSVLRSLPTVEDPATAAQIRAHLQRGRRDREKDRERSNSNKNSEIDVLTDPGLALRVDVENLVNSFLVLMTNMSYVTMISLSPNCERFLTAKVPGMSYPSGHSDPSWTIRQVWECLLGAVLPLWRDPVTLGNHPRLVQSVVSVMRNCTEHNTVTNSLTYLSRLVEMNEDNEPNRLQEQDVNIEHLRQIQDMGFSEAAARSALQRVDGYVELAIAWLAEHPNEVTAIEPAPETNQESDNSLSRDEQILTETAAVLLNSNDHMDADNETTKAAETQSKAKKPILNALPGDMPREVLPSAARAMRECLDVITSAPSSSFFMSDLLRTLGNRGHEQRDEMAKVLVQALSRMTSDGSRLAWDMEGMSIAVGRAYASLIDVCKSEGERYMRENPGEMSYWTAFNSKFESKSNDSFGTYIPEHQQMWLNKIREKALQGEYGTDAESKKKFMSDVRMIERSIIKYCKTMPNSELVDEMYGLASGMIEYFDKLVKRKDLIGNALEKIEKARKDQKAGSSMTEEEMFAVSYLTAVLVSDSGSLRDCLATHGLTHTTLEALSRYCDQNHLLEQSGIVLKQENVSDADAQRDGEGSSSQGMVRIPKWFDCLLLVLGQMSVVQPKAGTSQKYGRDGIGLQQVQQALQQVDVTAEADTRQERNEGAAALVGEQEDVGNRSASAAIVREHAAEASDASINPHGIGTSGGEGGETRQEDRLRAAFSAISTQWHVGGALSDVEQEQAAEIAFTALRKAYEWADHWDIPPPVKEEDSMVAEHLRRADPRSTAHASLQLLAKLSKIRRVAERLLSAESHRVLLKIPAPIYGSNMETYIGFILRHLMEDDVTLRAAMEAEIKSLLLRRPRSPSFLSRYENDVNASMPLRSFFSNMAPVAARNPNVFLEATESVCEFRAVRTLGGSQKTVIKLKSRHNQSEDRQKSQDGKEDKTKEDTVKGEEASGEIKASAASKIDEKAVNEKNHMQTPRTANKGTVKKISSCIVDVMDALLEVLMRYKGGPVLPRSDAGDKKSKSETEESSLEKESDSSDQILSSSQAEAALQNFVLRLVGDMILTYQHCINVVLKRDSDCIAAYNAKQPMKCTSSFQTPQGPSRQEGSSSQPMGSGKKSLPSVLASVELESCGLFRHIMDYHLALSPSKSIPGVPQSLSSSACYFFLAVCIRSSEGRKRTTHEILRVLNERWEEGKPLDPIPDWIQLQDTPYARSIDCPRPQAVAAVVALCASLLSGSMAVKPRLGSQAMGNVVSEIAKTMKEADMMRSLTAVLQKIDYNHRLASKSLSTVLRSLEILTRPWKPQRLEASADQSRINVSGDARRREEAERNDGVRQEGTILVGREDANQSSLPASTHATGSRPMQSTGDDTAAAAANDQRQGQDHAALVSPTDTEAGPQALAAAHRVMGALDLQERRQQNRDDMHDSNMIDRMFEVAFDDGEDHTGQSDSEESDDMSMSEVSNEEDEEEENILSHGARIAIGHIVGDDYDDEDEDESDSDEDNGPHRMSDDSEEDSEEMEDDSSSDDQGSHERRERRLRGMEIMGRDGVPIMISVGYESGSDEDQTSDSEYSSMDHGVHDEGDNDDNEEEGEDEEGQGEEDVNVDYDGVDQDDIILAEEMLMAEQSSDEDRSGDELEDDEDDYEIVAAQDEADDGITFDIGDDEDEFDMEEEYDEERDVLELLRGSQRGDPLLEDFNLDQQAAEEAETLRQPTDIYAAGSHHHRGFYSRHDPYFRRISHRASPPRSSIGRRDNIDHPLLIRPAGSSRPDGRSAGGGGGTTFVSDGIPGSGLGLWNRHLEGTDGVFAGIFSGRRAYHPTRGYDVGLRHTAPFTRWPGSAATWSDGDAVGASTYASLAQVLERAVGGAMAEGPESRRHGIGQLGFFDNLVPNSDSDDEDDDEDDEDDDDEGMHGVDDDHRRPRYRLPPELNDMLEREAEEAMHHMADDSPTRPDDQRPARERLNDRDATDVQMMFESLVPLIRPEERLREETTSHQLEDIMSRRPVNVEMPEEERQPAEIHVVDSSSMRSRRYRPATTTRPHNQVSSDEQPQEGTGDPEVQITGSRGLAETRDETASPPMSRPRQRRRMEGHSNVSTISSERERSLEDPASSPIVEASGATAGTNEGSSEQQQQQQAVDQAASRDIEMEHANDEPNKSQVNTENEPVLLQEPPQNAGSAPNAQDRSEEPRDDDLEGIDPEFLAALPPDLQAEVIEQHRQERRLRALAASGGQRLGGDQAGLEQRAEARGGEEGASVPQGSGEPLDADTEGNSGEFAALLASFPVEVQDEALISATEEQIASLPTNLREHAERLRERYSVRMQPVRDMMEAFAGAGHTPDRNRTERSGDQTGSLSARLYDAFGLGMVARMQGILGNELGMYGAVDPLRAEDMDNRSSYHPRLARLLGSRGYRGLHRAGRRSKDKRLTARGESAEPQPQMDLESILGLVRLLSISRLGTTSQMNRIFLNLAAAESTRVMLLKVLLALLRAPFSADEVEGSSSRPESMEIDAAASARTTQSVSRSIAEDLKLITRDGVVESLKALGIVNHVKPPDESQWVVPLTVRRNVVSVLQHLCSNHGKVSPTLIGLEVPSIADIARPVVLSADARGKGKARANTADAKHSSVPSLQLLLTLPCRNGCKKDSTVRMRVLDLLSVLLGPLEANEQEALQYEKERAKEKHEDKKDRKPQTKEEGSSEPEKATTEDMAKAPSRDDANSVQMTAQGGSSRPANVQTRMDATAASGEGEGASNPTNTDQAVEGNATRGQEDVSLTERQQDGGESSDRKQEKDRWYKEVTSHRHFFAQVPSSVAQALTRLLADPDFELSDADSLKIVLQGLLIIRPLLWPSVLKELKSAIEDIAQASIQGVKDLAQGGMYGSVALHSDVARQGRLLERCLSCLWENIAQFFLEDLDDSPSEATVERCDKVRKVSMPVVEGILSDLETTLWPSFLDAAGKIEAGLTTGTTQQGRSTAQRAASSSSDSRVMPPVVFQLHPLVESLFLLLESHRTLSTPLQVLSAEMKAKTSGSAEATMVGPASSPTPWMDRASSLTLSSGLSGSQHLHTMAPGSPTKHTNAGSPSKRNAGKVPLALSEGEPTLYRFAERHRRLINLMIHNDTDLLSGCLAPLLRCPRLLDFDNKRSYFRGSLKQSHYVDHRSLSISVRRDHVFEDSFNQLRMQRPEAFRGKLSVTFSGEEGVDAGGLTREWFQVMSREMFNPAISLFEAVPPDSSTFQPNPNSIIQSDPARGTNHLDFFKFVGRVVGKALRDGQHIDAHFTRSFYKHMLGMPLTYEDIEAVDPDFYKNLKWMLENDINDVLDLVFAEEVDFFGRKSMVELCPEGASIKVTNDNKREYVDLVARHRMTTAIRAQIDSFLAGFWDVVPRQKLLIFNDHELELLISGLPDIDVGDLRANTEYNGYTSKSAVVHWFWDIVNDMEQEDKALLLQFVTGTSKVPLDGFKGLQGVSGPQKFSIHKVPGDTDRLPTAHTCFNQLDLPEYENKEILKERLLMAIREGTEGFGFA